MPDESAATGSSIAAIAAQIAASGADEVLGRPGAQTEDTGESRPKGKGAATRARADNGRGRPADDVSEDDESDSDLEDEDEHPDDDEPDEESDEDASEDDDESEDDGEEEPDTLTVLRNGKPVQVTFDELLADRKFVVKAGGKEVEVPFSELQKGYQRQADYTRKTAELSAKRQEIDAQRETIIDQSRAEVSSRLQELEDSVKAVDQIFGEEPDWVKLQRDLDPKEFTRRQVLWKELEKLKTTARSAVKKERDALDAAAQKQRQATINRNAQTMIELIPEWRDEKRRIKEADQLAEYLAEQGIEGNTILVDALEANPALLVVYRQAMAFHKTKTAKERLSSKRRRTRTRVITPGSTTRQDGAKVNGRRTEEAARLMKSGKMKDIAKAIELTSRLL
jgi:cytochrome c556